MSHPVIQANLTEGSIVNPYRLNLCRREGAFASTLRLPVRHVSGLSAQEKVLRIAAWRIVTGVKDVQAVRDWAIRNLPRRAVSANKPQA